MECWPKRKGPMCRKFAPPGDPSNGTGRSSHLHQTQEDCGSCNYEALEAQARHHQSLLSVTADAPRPGQSLDVFKLKGRSKEVTWRAAQL